MSLKYWLEVLNYQITFIRAFESSPVHCLKPLPSGKRRRPANGGTTAILNEENEYKQVHNLGSLLTGDQCHQEFC